MDLSALDDRGNTVDWWFMYKIAGKSKTTGKTKFKGTQYVYFDSNGAEKNAKLALSPNQLNAKGALPNTLNQLYKQAGGNLGWFFYNDENPVDRKTNGVRGHTKGVLAFDLDTDTAFWLVQSTPLFPPQDDYSFPTTGTPNAQTLLCMSLKNADAAKAIANQMFSAQQPNVYLASAIPGDLVKQPNDPRVQVMHNQIIRGDSPVAATVPFFSKCGLKFMSIAKNKYWGLDFYNDLVGPALHDDLEVETWEHGTTPPSLDSDKIHTVLDMKGINLNPLGIPVSWPEPDDHAKLAISDPNETDHFICVGDMNFTLSMRERSGGTVAFKCEPLWSSISEILVGPTAHLKRGSKAAAVQASREAKTRKKPPAQGKKT